MFTPKMNINIKINSQIRTPVEKKKTFNDGIKNINLLFLPSEYDKKKLTVGFTYNLINCKLL